jgi:hypothetical protein
VVVSCTGDGQVQYASQVQGQPLPALYSLPVCFELLTRTSRCASTVSTLRYSVIYTSFDTGSEALESL